MRSALARSSASVGNSIWISCVMSGELAVIAPAGETYTRIVHPPRVDLTAVMRYPFSPNGMAFPRIPKISGEQQARLSLAAAFSARTFPSAASSPGTESGFAMTASAHPIKRPRGGFENSDSTLSGKAGA